MKVTAIIEKTQYGYDVRMNDSKFDFMLLGQGNTVQEAIDDFYISKEEMQELYNDENKAFPQDLEFAFNYDLSSFLEHYSKVFSYASLERLTGVNQSQLSQYVQGYRKPSKKTTQKIETSLHQLADELSHFSFLTNILHL